MQALGNVSLQARTEQHLYPSKSGKVRFSRIGKPVVAHTVVCLVFQNDDRFSKKIALNLNWFPPSVQEYVVACNAEMPKCRNATRDHLVT